MRQHRMNYDAEGGSVALQFFGMIGPAMADLIELHGFQETGKEFSRRYRKAYFDQAERDRLTRAAQDMQRRYATGQKEYCKELLTSDFNQGKYREKIGGNRK